MLSSWEGSRERTGGGRASVGKVWEFNTKATTQDVLAHLDNRAHCDRERTLPSPCVSLGDLARARARSGTERRFPPTHIVNAFYCYSPHAYNPFAFPLLPPHAPSLYSSPKLSSTICLNSTLISFTSSPFNPSFTNRHSTWYLIISNAPRITPHNMFE